MKNVKICLKRIKTVSVSSDSPANIKSEKDVYPNILQIKTENIEWDDHEYDEENTDKRQSGAIVHDDNGGQGNQLSQHTLVAQELIKHSKYEDDASPAELDIKLEPEVDISLRGHEFDEIEFEDESSAEILKCPACRYECRTTEILENHLIENHTEDQMCSVSNKEFQPKPSEHCSVQLHVNRSKRVLKSTNIKRHKCKICSETFVGRYYLKKHLITHTGETPYKCEICSSAFNFKHNLTRHLICHSSERPFKCEICVKDFQRKSHLLRHLSCHSIEKPFKCEICPKEFRYKPSLTVHLRWHANERPFECQLCSMTFQYKSSFTRHLRCHTSEKPFKCEICMRDFRRKTHLRDHLKCHSIEKSFKCEICSKIFHQKSSFTRHLKRHTENNERKKGYARKQLAMERSEELIRADPDSKLDEKSQEECKIENHVNG